MLRHLLIVISIIVNVSIFATPKPINPIIKKLLSVKGAVKITYLGNEYWFEIDDLPNNFKKEGQHLLKTDNGLYLTIPGTGRLYMAQIIGNNIDFIRIDSTYFSGYNFNSISFNIGNSIYNFGGEGFWHTNGGLRLFDTTTREWNAIKLNKTVYRNFNFNYLASFLYILNSKDSSLIIEGSQSDQNYVKEPYADSTFKHKLYKLNIEKGDWIELGKKNFQNICNLSYTPLGIFSYENIIDLEKNKIYNHNLNFKLTSIFGNSTNDNHITISFCIDSTIYFGNANHRFDSLTISRSNLTDTQLPAYFPTEKATLLSKLNVCMILLICSTMGFLILLYDKYFRKSSSSKNALNDDFLTNSNQQINNESIDNPIVYKSGKLVELLSDQEKEFLSYIFNNSKDDRLTTIEETNKILGTFNKSIEIQKRVRGEMINGINQKLSIITKVKEPIIEKQRSEFDKRSFEYFVNSNHFDLVNDVLSLHKST